MTKETKEQTNIQQPEVIACQGGGEMFKTC